MAASRMAEFGTCYLSQRSLPHILRVNVLVFGLLLVLAEAQGDFEPTDIRFRHKGHRQVLLEHHEVPLGSREVEIDQERLFLKNTDPTPHDISGFGERPSGLDELSPRVGATVSPIKDRELPTQDLVAGIDGILSKEVSSGSDVQLLISQDLVSLMTDSDAETGSHGESGSREAASAEVTSGAPESVVTTPELPSNVIDERPMDIEALVKNLQYQVIESKTSQARTRSILNVITEKQASQERDLAILKDEISVIRADQERDHNVLQALQTQVSDSAWAIANLKTGQDQFHQDLTALKKLQENQNETLQGFGSYVDQSQGHRHGYRDFLTRLHIEVQHLKSRMGSDHDTMGRLKKMLTSLEWARKEMSSKHNHINSIPVVPAESGSLPESSGETYRTDTIASAYEESDNSIGHNLVELFKHKHHMHMQIENVNKRFLQYDAEMSRVYAMYFNLSLQISALENKLLSHRQSQFDSDLSRLQRSFINFTQQIFNLEQWHVSTQGHFNVSSQNQQQLTQVSSTVDNHHIRIRAMERVMLDYRASNDQMRTLFKRQLSVMNTTMGHIRSRLKEHKSKAALTIDDVEEKLSNFRSTVKDHNHRLQSIEVKVLNESLRRCKKANEDLIQDVKLSEFSNQLQRVDGRVGDHTGLMARFDRSLSTLYQELKSNNHMMTDIMIQTKVLVDLIPRTTSVEEEVTNLISELPKDCSTRLNENNHESGIYLIKPLRSKRSVRAFCEEEGTGPWTVIQRRHSGVETFARSWDEYRVGFGSLDEEFWIGNDNLHFITTQMEYRLHIDMWDLDNQYWTIDYDYFRVDEESTNYRLLIDGFHGNGTDALKYSNLMPFSTMDRDNDVSSTHCAKFYTAGWWYKHCHYSNLNGRYTVGIVWFNHDFDEWMQMKRTVMKIQPVNATASYR